MVMLKVTLIYKCECEETSEVIQELREEKV